MKLNSFNTINKSSKYNLDIIKNMSINPDELSISIPQHEDIQLSQKSLNLNKKNMSYNDTPPTDNIQNPLNLSNSNYSSDYCENITNEQEDNLSIEKNNISGSNYITDENNNYNISQKGNNIDFSDEDKDKFVLIKKQNDKIDELFNLLELKDKEIHSLKSENNSLYKYKNDFKISEQQNINKDNLLNKYEEALNLGKHDLNNINNELINYKDISKDLQYEINSMKKEYENIILINQKLNKKIKVIEKENNFLKEENIKLYNKINLCKKKYKNSKNEKKILEENIKKLKNININLDDKIKDNEEIILQLQKDNEMYMNELKEFKENNLSNEQKIIYFQEKNNKIINEIKEINKKEINLKSYISNIFDYFSKQVVNLMNKSKSCFQNINNDYNINNKSIIYNNNLGLNLNSDYSNVVKEIPILSNLEIIYNEIKKFIDLFLNNYENLKNTYNNEMNNFNKTINNMNNNILELNRKLELEKEQNNLLTKKNQNNIDEINKNIYDLNNNNKISVKFRILKDFIYGFYNNILNNYNTISSKAKSEGKNLLFKKEPKKYINDININNSSNNDFENENNIKEVIIETERIFNNLYEYINYLEEELKKLNMLEQDNSILKKEKIEFIKNINILKNELNILKIDNENKNNNLKIKFDLSLKEQIKNIENKNNEIIKMLNEQIQKKEDEILNVNKNYNLLYNQYKSIVKNNNFS